MTVSYRVALKGICFQLQMVVRAHAEILMVDKSLSRDAMSRGDYLTLLLTSSVLHL